MNELSGFPEFIEDLPDDQAQPVRIDPQDQFVAIKQMDLAGPDEAVHWVLVRKDEIEDFIARLREAASREEEDV